MQLKKRFLVLGMLVALMPLPLDGFAQTGVIGRGVRSGAVQDIQIILKGDSTIYPEGLVTGFYGPATEKAVKNLQARYGLPQTGVVDEVTLQVLFPYNVQLNVISPNGGEVWNKSNNHNISWSVTVAPVLYQGKEVTSGASSSPGLAIMPQERPFFDRISIDLIRDSNPNFLYHIATANLYQTQYSWNVPAKLANANDYRIRLSIGSNVPCLYQLPPESISSSAPISCRIWYPQYSYTDVSDNLFSITGSTIENNTVERLRELIKQMQQTLNILQSQLNSFNQLVSTL